MAKEFLKAEYSKGFPHGQIKITHNMSLEHIQALHSELTKIMVEMAQAERPRKVKKVRKPCIIIQHEEFPIETNARLARRLPAGLAESIFFGVVGSAEAVESFD